MSYQQFAKINECTVADVSSLCESEFGCTYYDPSKQRYLILCNQSTNNNNNKGRQRWTCSHEIGHILCGHHNITNITNLSGGSILPQVSKKEFELEADYFAATLLSPFPLFELFNIKSALDVQKTFGLSKKASLYRYERYLKWKSYHRKTAWENDIISIYYSRTYNT